MKRKLLITLASVIGIFIIIGIIAVVTPTEEPASPPTTEKAPEATTEEPALTSAEQAYLTTIGNQTTTVGDTFAELSNLFQNPQFGNEDWILTTALGFLIIRRTYDEAMELDPPSSMAEIHLKYIQAMKHYNEFTYLAAQGIDELDASLLEKAAAEMDAGRQLIDEATGLMIEFGEAHK